MPASDFSSGNSTIIASANFGIFRDNNQPISCDTFNLQELCGGMKRGCCVLGGYCMLGGYTYKAFSGATSKLPAISASKYAKFCMSCPLTVVLSPSA